MGLPRFRVITSPDSVNGHIDYETIAGATPLGLNLLSLYPLPNNPGGPFGANTFTKVLPASGHGGVSSLKITQRIATNHNLSARYNFTDDDRELPSIRRAISSTIASELALKICRLYSIVRSFDTLVNQARFSFGRTRLDFIERTG